MIEETKIQQAWALVLRICGLAVLWLAVGESVTHMLLDIFKLDVHPTPATGRLNGIVAIITIIAGAQGGTKWIQYKREKDCMLPRKGEE